MWCTYAHGQAYWQEAQAEALRVLRRTDYQLFLRTASHEIFGWSDNEQALRYAEIVRESAIPEEADKLIAATRVADIRDDLSRVLCPTLVMHQSQLRWLNVSLSRDLASKIPFPNWVY